MAWRMFAGNVVGMMLTVTVGCSAPDNFNNTKPTTDGSLCVGKADCPITVDAGNSVDNDSSGATDDTNGGANNDNGVTTDISATDPCIEWNDVLAPQLWECHYGDIKQCNPACLVYEGKTLIVCGGGNSLASDTVFVPSVDNPTEVKMDYGGGTTCYNITPK